jgi:hypothetical protein
VPPGSITTFDLKKKTLAKGVFLLSILKKLPVPPGSFTPASQKTHSTKQIHRVESSHTLTLKKNPPVEFTHTYIKQKNSPEGIHTHTHPHSKK